MADWLCENWQCPASASCARSWGRSRQYWSMDRKHPKLVRRMVSRADGSCDDYERDRPRPWLLKHAGMPAFAALDGSMARG